MSDNIKNINHRLALTYGTNLINEPYFRIVWSDEQIEKRIGVFVEHYGKIFLREIRGLREVPKYNYIHAKWILERWIPPVYAHTPEIPETIKGSYEPIYVFQDQLGNSLTVHEEFTHQVIWKLFHPDMPGDRASKLRTQEETELKKEIDFSMMVMEDANPYLVGKLHGHEAIVVP